jgi:hypothetical protein
LKRCTQPVMANSVGRRSMLEAPKKPATPRVWFYQEQGSDILKAELPFSVVKEGD